MSKSCQNNTYYEINVISQFNYSSIEEYVTELPIVNKAGIVHVELMKLMWNEHGKDIIILYNKKEGKLPNDRRSVIYVNIPQEPELKYNR